MQETEETWVRSLVLDDPLEKGMATHSSLLAGESHGQRSLVGDIPWDHKESDMTEQLNNNQWIQPLGVASPPDTHFSLLGPMSQSLARNLGPPLTLLAPFLSTDFQQPILSTHCLHISLLPSLLLSHVSPIAAVQV